jgi:hypothetical protein
MERLYFTVAPSSTRKHGAIAILVGSLEPFDKAREILQRIRNVARGEPEDSFETISAEYPEESKIIEALISFLGHYSINWAEYYQLRNASDIVSIQIDISER